MPDAEDDAGVVEMNTADAMNTSGTFDVLANDSDADGGSLRVIDATAANGTVFEENGKLTYTPDEGFLGNDTVHYKVDSGDGTASASAKLEIYVNADPEAKDDAGSVAMNTSGTFDVLANDSDANEEETLSVTSAAADNGSVAIEEDGRLTYTPNDGFFGEDTVKYTIEDEHKATDTADLIVTVIEAETEEEVEDDSNDSFAEVFAAVGVFMLILMASGM